MTSTNRKERGGVADPLHIVERSSKHTITWLFSNYNGTLYRYEIKRTTYKNISRYQQSNMQLKIRALPSLLQQQKDTNMKESKLIQKFLQKTKIDKDLELIPLKIITIQIRSISEVFLQLCRNINPNTKINL